MPEPRSIGRRTLIQGVAAGAVAGILPLGVTQAAAVLTRPIAKTGEAIPVVGLGSWITFNVGNDPIAREACAGVMRAFFESGGRLIDSSPMYGSSQATIGYGLVRLGHPPTLFSADKVWISSGARGSGQVEQSRRLWDVVRFDLLQVHNLLSWEDHLPMLQEMKAAGRVRYVGITTSEGRRHGELERIMARHPLDFIQVTYNPLDREVEDRILPLAQERAIAVLVNRPFRQGSLTQRLVRHKLPAWAGEIGCRSWAQAILKCIVSHPAVTCVIPATTKPDHARENLEAAAEPLPDASLRRRIVADLERL